MRWIGLLVIFLAVALIFLFQHYVFRFDDPFQDPMKAVARLPPPVPIENNILVIKARSEAFYKLGYAHAYNRFFQIDVMRRAVEGRLSELLGDAALDTDVYFRTRGLYRSAEKTWSYIKSNYPEYASLIRGV